VNRFLHVASSNISKAEVNPYLGKEIPNYIQLGLDPSRVYFLLRDPTELAAGAHTFNNLPILAKHDPKVSADNIPENLIIGTTGDKAEFNSPYLTNSLAFWKQDAINNIETDSAKQLSCGYRYIPDMTPGTYNGTPYDGVMRNIRGNHVALVPDGRAGDDVVVGDCSLAMESAMPGEERKESPEAKSTEWIENYKKEIPRIIHKIGPKLAKDANTEELVKDLAGMFDAPSNPDSPDLNVQDGEVKPEAPEEKPLAKPPVPVPGEDEPGENKQNEQNPLTPPKSPEPTERNKESLDSIQTPVKDKDDVVMNRVREMLRHVLAELDSPSATSEADKPATDNPPPTPGAPAPPVRSAIDENREKEEVDKPAMDAAIKVAVKAAEKATIANLREIDIAKKAVHPLVGELAVACDSAEEVYAATLKTLGIAISNVHPSAYVHIVNAQRKPSGNLAMDHAVAKTNQSKMLAMFPSAARLM
jgi:hypothetical protein